MSLHHVRNGRPRTFRTGDLCCITTKSRSGREYTCKELMALTLELGHERSRSRGVVMPFSPSSLPPTTGTQNLESRTAILCKDIVVVIKSIASWPMLAVETTGWGNLVQELDETFAKEDHTDNYESFSWKIKWIGWCNQRHFVKIEV